MRDPVVNSAPVAPRQSRAWPLAAVLITMLLLIGLPVGYLIVRAAQVPGKALDSVTRAAADVLRPKIDIHEQVLSSVSDLRKENKLVVMSADVNTDVTLNEAESSWGIYWGTNSARVSVQNARVQYVIETGTVGASDYNYDEGDHVLRVTIPHPHLDTAQVAIDPAKVYTLDLRGGWLRFDKAETRDHAVAELRPQVINEAQAPHLRELADIRGIEATTKLLQPLAQTLTRDNITLQVVYRDE